MSNLEEFRKEVEEEVAEIPFQHINNLLVDLLVFVAVAIRLHPDLKQFLETTGEENG